MTAEPDLLPLRDWMECLGEANAEDIRDYARANVARAIAPLQAEVEALRAEVETLRDGLDYLRQMQGVPDVLELRAKAARAERLAEALRNSSDALERLAFAIRAPNAHTPQLVELAIAMRAAALEAFRDGTTSPVTSPVRILIDAIESEIRQLEGTAAWKSQAARIASLRAAIDAVRENNDA